MVGLVIVAHSATLAEGVKELVEQMVQGRVPIATAGGVDDPQNPFGTDAMRVLEAIRQVYSEDGVVVLMDLGSAVLSAEMALEFLPEEQRRHVYLCEAPLVEGAIAAAVQAAAGGDVERVLAEARAALSGKQAQLGAAATTPPTAPSAPPAQGQEVRVRVRNRLGLHARPAAQFVATASRFQARIHVRNVTRGTGPADAKSINQIATLGVRQGDEIAITAEGPDAAAALQALVDLVEANFGEPEDLSLPEEPKAGPPPPTSPAPPPNLLRGIPASPGIAVGPAHIYRPLPPEIPDMPALDPAVEWAHLEAALAQARQEIDALRARAAAEVDAYTAALFDAHRLILDDPALLEAARRHIDEAGLNAAAAWHRAVEAVVAAYERLEDPYLRQRAADVRDVGLRVLRHLAGTAALGPRLERPAILVAEDLLPSETMHLDREKTLGICTALGGATSHAAILARALGIPAVVGVGVAILNVPEGEELALNGETGEVWVHPTPEQKARLQARREAWQRGRQQAAAVAEAPAVTQDGRRVQVLANIVGVADAQAAVTYGAEGVGLFRTEFLFVNRAQPPDEDEQVAVYREVLEVLGDRPCVIRTLDIGGDKPIPYLHLAAEANPFLGWRGVRLTLDEPDLLRTQLRAILRAAAGREVKIMVPMVTLLAEVQAVRRMLEEVRAALAREGHALPRAVALGIMVETPAAALLADVLAPAVDFFSLGTNDLSQYTMAADRTNDRVARLADALHPAVLRLIRQTVEAGHAVGIDVSVCGEAAGDLLAVPVLVGLGVDALSMNPPTIPEVKALIRRLSLAEARALAQEVLTLPDGDAVRERVRQVLKQHGDAPAEA